MFRRFLVDARFGLYSGGRLVLVHGLRAHPRTTEARDAGHPGKQGSSARGRPHHANVLCKALDEQDFRYDN